MATYVNNLRLTELATGEGSGTWGTTTNTSLELIGEALGYNTQDCFSSDADATTTVADGATDPARSFYFKVTSSATLTATRTLTIAPNTVSRVMFIENATTGSQSITISQGSGANVTIATGRTAVVYLDGAGSGAAVVDAMANVDPGVTDTLAEVLVAGNTTGGTNIVFGDSSGASDDRLVFGDSSDLQIYHDGTDNVFDSSTTFTFDGETEGKLIFKDSGTSYGRIDSNGASGFDITSEIQDGDLRLRGNDGGSTINALTLDMSAAGAATFNSTIALGDNKQIFFGAGSDGRISFDGTDTLNITASNGTATTLNLTANNFTIGGASALISGTANDSVVINEASGDIDFRVESDSNTHALFVDAGNSRVGINESAPDAPLHITASTSATIVEALRIENTASGGQEGNSIVFNPMFDGKATIAAQRHAGNANGTEMFFTTDTTGATTVEHLRFATGSNTVFNESSADQDFRVESNNSTHALFVDASLDRVGVKTTSPGEAFDVNGTARALTVQARRQNHGGDVSVSANQTGTAYLDLASTASLILGATSITTVNSAKIVADHSIGSTGDHRQMLTFHPVAGNSLNYEAFRIRDTEIVANETGSAAQDFRIESGSCENMLKVDAGSNQVLITGDAGNTGTALRVRNNFNNVMKILQDDTSLSNNTFTFEIDSSAQVSNLTTAGAMNVDTFYGSAFKINGMGTTIINEAGVASGDFRVESDTDAGLFFVDASTSRVGIGTQSPETFLDVRGNVTVQNSTDGATQLKIENSNTGASSVAQLFLDGQGNNFYIKNYGDGTSNANLTDLRSTAGSSEFAFSPASTETMRIKQNLVGINETSPDYSLHVKSGTTNVVAKFESTDSTSVIQFVDPNGNSEFGTSGNTARISPNGSYAVLEASQSAVVLNNASQDTDFRVESNAEAHAIFVDAGNDRVGLFSSSPTSGYKVSFGGGAFNVIDDDAINRITSTAGYSVETGGTGNQFRICNVAGHGARGRIRAVGSIGYGDPMQREYIIEVGIGNASEEFGVNVYQMGDPVGHNTFKQLNAEFLVYTDRINSAAFDVWIELGHFTRLDFFLEDVTGITGYFDNSGTSTLPATAVETNTKSELLVFAEQVRIGTQNSAQSSSFENMRAESNQVIFNENSADIDFRVESDSDANMLVVDAGNSRVGIGVAAPANTFEVNGSASFGNTNTNNSIIINGKQDGTVIKFNAGGSHRFDLDCNGTGTDNLSFNDINETKMLTIYRSSQVVVNEDSTSSVDFRAESDNNSDMLVVDASGNRVIIGRNLGSATLEIYEASNKTEADAHFRVVGSGYSGNHWLDGAAYYIGQNSTSRALRFYSGAETAGAQLTNGATSFTTFSDERLKYDVEPIENALDSLSGLRTVKYRLEGVDSPSDKKKLGVIAQDLVGVHDEVLDPMVRSDDDTEYMGVRYTELVPVLIKAVQEQTEIINDLRARVAQLESN
jgi:hypothetical protein